MSDHSGGCAKCLRGNHQMCTGFDGDIGSNHPDSLPLCVCFTCRVPSPPLTAKELAND